MTKLDAKQLKRSVINKAINNAISFFRENIFPLPPFAYWTLNDWKKNRNNLTEIKKAGLGWDITDFGSGNFSKIGRTIFTLRNGYKTKNGFTKSYAQKAMYLLEAQKSPIHYHKNKTEDIINQAGGNIIIKLWSKTKSNTLSSKELRVSIDGIKRQVKAGQILKLKPGQSICVKPFTYHQFYAEPKKGKVVSMEISSVNNDLTDNFWLNEGERFPEILEDEKLKFILCSEYDKYLI